MGSPLKTYDLKRVTCFVNVNLLSGYGESGAISAEWVEDIGEITTGADGEQVFSRSNNRGMRVSITLMETSRSYRDLYTELVAQGILNQVPIGIFSLLDLINGDSITSEYFVFTKRPTVAKGKKAGERVFEIFLPDPLVTMGTLNAS